MPVRKKPSALQRMQKLIADSGSDSRSSETAAAEPLHAGDDTLNANPDSNVPQGRQEPTPSTTRASDEQGATINDPSRGESNFQQESGATTTDQVDDSIMADDDQEKFQSRPDHSEGSQEAKRRKIFIPEVNIGIRLLLHQTTSFYIKR